MEDVFQSNLKARNAYAKFVKQNGTFSLGYHSCEAFRDRSVPPVVVAITALVATVSRIIVMVPPQSHPWSFGHGRGRPCSLYNDARHKQGDKTTSFHRAEGHMDVRLSNKKPQTTNHLLSWHNSAHQPITFGVVIAASAS